MEQFAPDTAKTVNITPKTVYNPEANVIVEMGAEVVPETLVAEVRAPGKHSDFPGTDTHAHKHTHRHRHTYTHVHTHTYIYTHTHRHTHRHTNIHIDIDTQL